MKSLILCLVLGTYVIALENPASLEIDNATSTQLSKAKEAAMEKLFSTLGQDEFGTALQEAQQADVHPQVLLEARFLNLIDLENYAAIAGMAPELNEKRDAFDPNHSEVFALKDDWLAIVHYAQALAALEKNNKGDFKKHITEAFWLSPRQAQAFGQHIERLQLDEAMQSIKLPLTKSLKSQIGGQLATLAQHMEGSKAIILYFWNPMSQEIQVNLPDFVVTTQTCHLNNIPVLAILTGQYPDMIQDAEIIRKEDAAQAQCTWLIDSNNKSLGSLLRVRDIPTMVIVSPEGKILFNGHPADNAFWIALEKLSPKFKRPNSNIKKGS
jgi:hypothetical protein